MIYEIDKIDSEILKTLTSNAKISLTYFGLNNHSFA